MSAIEREARNASINRLSAHAVGIVNGIRVLGYDPVTQRRGDAEEPGTGSAGRWGNHYFVLTAKHVVEKATPSDLRLFFCANGRVEYRRPSELRADDIVDAVPLRDEGAVIHRCEWEDLAVITMSGPVPKVEYFDAVNEWTDPPVGELLHYVGFPLDYGQLVGKRMVGQQEERTIALYPTVFSTAVLPPPTEDELRFKVTAFDPRDHYLVGFDDATKGVHPRGISGAAMWWESEQKELIWRPRFEFAGVCSYKQGSVVQVVKAFVVRRFLAEVFGPANGGPGGSVAL
ncbi:MAG TPA: hypothetical protein VEJ46_03980 [Candidatus Acidoferrum sp.]|nr:hypothetical protein [Candidatus Acidoferrum sp.]